MSSPLLYHGPTSFDEALIEAHKIGRLLCPPVGEGGLKKDEARDLVELLSYPPIGDALGSVVIGPMDLCLPASGDVLLKTLEDGSDKHNRILLWAYDLGEVRPTVKSRCLPVWCGGAVTVDDDLSDLSERLYRAFLDRDLFEVTSIASEAKSKEAEVLRHFVDFLSDDISKHLDFWEGLRHLCGYRRLTPAQFLEPFIKRCL